MERDDLIERVRALLADEAADFEADLVAASETGERIDLDAREIDVPVDWLHRLLATIERLTAEREEAERKGSSAEAIIGKFQSLVMNVEYWVAHGQSETATRAMIQARKEGWSEMGWRQHLQTYLYPPRALSQGGEHE